MNATPTPPARPRKPSRPRRATAARQVTQGDTPPNLTPAGVERFAVAASVEAAQPSRRAAAAAIVEPAARGGVDTAAGVPTPAP